MKNVLLIYYTQSGQLKEIADQLSKSLVADEQVNVNFLCIEPQKPFPFPWDKASFFDAFPETFLQLPVALKPIPLSMLDQTYDLILLHYQVWYLSPSIPINSFLKSPEAKKLLDGVPVITISGSRNMWVMAQEKVKLLLKESGSHLVGNIALVDRVGNLISVVTIVEWMFSGVKRKYLGIFPLPGVSHKDIVESEKFGTIIKENLKSNRWENLQSKLVANGAVKISSYLVTVDRTANKIFKKWSHIITSNRKYRKILLKLFYWYLFLAIWLISPIVYILHVFTYPLNLRKIKREAQYFQGV